VVEARAKLTVSLRVTGTRADGYHLIDAEIVTLDLADQLEFTPGDGLEVVSERSQSVPTRPDNLVCRALATVDRQAAVRLTKESPAGGGLDKTSPNAAAVLR